MWLRLLARLGFLIIKRPPKEVRQDVIEDAVMIYHHCPSCGDLRYDRLYDWVSQNEHFHCGSCNYRRYTHGVIGLMVFPVIEAARTAKEENLGVVRTWFRILFGVPERLLPPDRSGRTAGDLETSTWPFIEKFFKSFVEVETERS